MIYLLDNKIQEYAWGDTHSIANLLGVQNQKKPQAELWMGAHPKAPSYLNYENNKISLIELIAKDPNYYLGSSVAKKYQQLPFLFKILAAGSPLSIQVHPNLTQAKDGFAKENLLKVPLEAGHRNYKDDNHKPEIICALTNFYAMNGFLSTEKIIKNFSDLENPVAKKLLEILLKNDKESLRVFFETIMRLSHQDKEIILKDAIKVAEKKSGLESEWVLKLNLQYPGDIGILCPLFLNVIMLHPGEAMFLEAGRLHSYLFGLGVELMANSDNVLRGGLTPKHVDIDELLNVLVFKAEPIQILKPQGFLEEKFYKDFADEFSLSVIETNEPNFIDFSSDERPSILLCLTGVGHFIVDGHKIEFHKGQSFFVPAGQTVFKLSGACKFYKATVSSKA